MIFPVFHREQKQQKHGRQGGRTPLMFAAMFGRREVVDLFFPGRNWPGFPYPAGRISQKDRRLHRNAAFVLLLFYLPENAS